MAPTPPWGQPESTPVSQRYGSTASTEPPNGPMGANLPVGVTRGCLTRGVHAKKLSSIRPPHQRIDATLRVDRLPTGQPACPVPACLRRCHRSLVLATPLGG